MKNIVYDEISDVSALTWKFGYTTKFIEDVYTITFVGDFSHECEYDINLKVRDILHNYIVDDLHIPSETILKVAVLHASLDFTDTNRRLHVLLKGDWRNK